MEAFRNGIVAVVILIGLLCAWSFVSADDVGVFINGRRVVCDCPACTCPACRCTGACACPDCQGKKPAVSFPNGDAGKAGLTKPLQIIRFTADWCGPCHAMAPAWSRVAAENPGLMSELDLDENGPLARQWGVTAIPCVVIVRDGKLLTRYRAGVLSEGQLRAIVQRWK
jgi:thiol-disulfide isomerase/thioredoxin